LAGESLFNFKDLAERLVKVVALKITSTADAIYNELSRFIKNPQECDRLGALEKNEISASSGTIKRNVEEFLKVVNF
ncbi:hypothetical protein HY605_00715, partial [Candidatus Peregrinibacteria bacterium]|nr:hypothetical protein [Candidatus Peregrinibacteria bacterium]